MTGVSYMIPFVAAGGILIALSFMIAQAAVGENGAIEVTNVPLEEVATNFNFSSGMDYAALFFHIGAAAFGFLVPALAGFIAFAIADRPGIVPGFVGGALSVSIGAGFLGGIAAGLIGGLIALWLARRKVPKGIRGVMPVVVIPLVSTFLTGAIMLIILGRPLKALSDSLADWLSGMSGANAVVLGVILGLMMAFDMGGPVNKVAYTFAVTGLAAAGAATDAPELKIMAAVMAAGMTPPLGLALATRLRKNLFTEPERENGNAAWLLGASFITEGAIPFAAADPLRVIPSGHGRLRDHRRHGDGLRQHAARSARRAVGDPADRWDRAVHDRHHHRHRGHRGDGHRAQTDERPPAPGPAEALRRALIGPVARVHAPRPRLLTRPPHPTPSFWRTHARTSRHRRLQRRPTRPARRSVHAGRREGDGAGDDRQTR